ncbi:MAG: hypothetical protein Q4A44_05660, partial [Bacteroidales bacterium]|nr:hypothetical protein [Bacteroidales bacterium]
MLAAEQDAQAIAFIQNFMPKEHKGVFNDEQLQYIIDVAAEYYEKSGVLEAETDEVYIDLDAVVDFILQMAKKEGEGNLNKEALYYVVEGDIAFTESLED